MKAISVSVLWLAQPNVPIFVQAVDSGKDELVQGDRTVLTANDNVVLVWPRGENDQVKKEQNHHSKLQLFLRLFSPSSVLVSFFLARCTCPSTCPSLSLSLFSSSLCLVYTALSFSSQRFLYLFLSFPRFLYLLLFLLQTPRSLSYLVVQCPSPFLDCT